MSRSGHKAVVLNAGVLKNMFLSPQIKSPSLQLVLQFLLAVFNAQQGFYLNFYHLQ